MLVISSATSITGRPSAQALAAANKRISNILKKQSQTVPAIAEELLQENAEKQLFDQLQKLKDGVAEQFSQGNYLGGLEQLAELRPAVDLFFDEVMVMVDDEAVRDNRLALLNQLLQSFRLVADFSRIQS